MKKVLIITNLFHSSPRIIGLAKYISKIGWRVTILTIPADKVSQNTLGELPDFLENVKIIETPYCGDIFWVWRKLFKIFGYSPNMSIPTQIKKEFNIFKKKSFIDTLLSCYQTVFAYPDTERNWKKSAVKTAGKILEKEKFDAIISSSSPVTSHLIAYELKKRFFIPWLADFRDPWTKNHNYSYCKIRKYFEEKLEEKIIKDADILTAASPIFAKKQENFHKKTTINILNGFDPENLKSLTEISSKKFTIIYTGNIYIGKQDPGKLFFAIRNLISDGIIDPNDLEVKFYGTFQNWLENEIKKYDLQDVVKQFKRISKEEALKEQRGSQVLLHLNWEDAEEKEVYGSKIFEYFSSQKPILATGGFSGTDIEKIIEETKTGLYASTIEQIERSLTRFYKEYKEKGKISYNGDLMEIQKYSQKEMAKKFANVLNKII